MNKNNPSLIQQAGMRRPWFTTSSAELRIMVQYVRCLRLANVPDGFYVGSLAERTVVALFSFMGKNL
jgi:hypothetical protein